jgi:hypothetical protein
MKFVDTLLVKFVESLLMHFVGIMLIEFVAVHDLSSSRIFIQLSSLVHCSWRVISKYFSINLRKIFLKCGYEYVKKASPMIEPSKKAINAM